jgi:hypothetical protein
VIGREVAVGAAASTQLIGRALSPSRGLVRGDREALEGALHGRRQQVVDVGEVEIDRGRGDAYPLGDAPQGERPGALRLHHRERRRDRFLAQTGRSAAERWRPHESSAENQRH